MRVAALAVLAMGVLYTYSLHLVLAALAAYWSGTDAFVRWTALARDRRKSLWLPWTREQKHD